MNLPIVLLLIFCILALIVVVQISLARYHAIRDRQDNVAMFGGAVRLLSWEPNEGLVLLRYKRVSDVIVGDGGGMRFIYPFRGEELRARIPLTLRLITWNDTDILTRESIQVMLKVAVWWRVADLKKYVFTIDTRVNVDNSRLEMGPLGAAEEWLQTLTESSIRTLVSQISVALLVSAKPTSYLHVDSHCTTESSTARGASQVLAHDLQIDLENKAQDYGIEVQRVEIQEIGLSDEIQAAIDRVWKASLLPAQTEQEAKARQIELQAVANVLGVDTVALNEIMKNFQGASFMGVPAFFETLMGRVSDKTSQTSSLFSNGNQSPSITDGL
jgi:regulator of protease activity HflC (stomatin/prohibitin superfamily)